MLIGECANAISESMVLRAEDMEMQDANKNVNNGHRKSLATEWRTVLAQFEATVGIKRSDQRQPDDHDDETLVQTTTQVVDKRDFAQEVR